MPCPCAPPNPWKPLLTQQPPEGDGRGQGREVDEDDSSQALGVECISEVTQVVGIAAPHIPDQAPKGPARPPEGIVFDCTRHLYHLQERCNPGLRQGARRSPPCARLPPPRAHRPPRPEPRSPRRGPVPLSCADLGSNPAPGGNSRPCSSRFLSIWRWK